jgi:hypothetical protein
MCLQGSRMFFMIHIQITIEVQNVFGALRVHLVTIPPTPANPSNRSFETGVIGIEVNTRNNPFVAYLTKAPLLEYFDEYITTFPLIHGHMV